MRNRHTTMRSTLTGALAAAIAVTAGGQAAAEPDPVPARFTTPVQLSISEDVQVFPPGTSVVGARLGISSSDADVTGFDQAALAARTSGNQRGLQAALYAEVGGDLRGVQLALVSANVDGTATGLQCGNLINRAAAVTGAQIAALFNYALRVTGVQLSLVNYAEDLEGVQLGLVNINRSGWVPVLPGINVGF